MKTIKFCGIALFCLVIMGTIAFNSGCSMMDMNPTANSPCLGIEPGASKICEITGNPQDLSFLLKLANAAAMKKNVYRATEALRVVDGLISVLEPGTETFTYAGLMKLLNKEIDPVLFVVISEYQGQFMALDIPILPYDMELILLHLNKQRVIILMALESYGASFETDCLGGAGPYKPRPNCEGGGDRLSFSSPVITGTNARRNEMREDTETRILLASGGAGY